MAHCLTDWVAPSLRTSKFCSPLDPLIFVSVLDGELAGLVGGVKASVASGFRPGLEGLTDLSRLVWLEHGHRDSHAVLSAPHVFILYM